MYQKVEVSGINTANLPTLSEEQKEEYLRRSKEGDEGARNELIAGNLRLVLSVIQKFSRRCDNPDDLFQVGCVGLIKAVDNFDIDQNVKFSTYAVPMIIGEVRRYLRDNNMIRVSRSMRDLAYKALTVRENLTVQYGREPTNPEICKALNERLQQQAAAIGEEFSPYSEKQIEEALDAVVDPVSLYDPVYSEGGDSIYLMDQIFDTKGTSESWVENIALGEAIKTLGPREKTILNLRFFQGKTQMEVASEIGMVHNKKQKKNSSAFCKKTVAVKSFFLF